jgi:excisionase family DNA binding protein
MPPDQIDRLDAIDSKLDTLLQRITPTDRRFLSVSDAAAYSGLSEDSVRRLLDVGRLTALRPVRGRIVVDRRQLDAFLLSSTSRPIGGRGSGARRVGETVNE